jgi:hypothetical protein
MKVATGGVELEAPKVDPSCPTLYATTSPISAARPKLHLAAAVNARFDLEAFELPARASVRSNALG